MAVHSKQGIVESMAKSKHTQGNNIIDVTNHSGIKINFANVGIQRQHYMSVQKQHPNNLFDRVNVGDGSNHPDAIVKLSNRAVMCRQDSNSSLLSNSCHSTSSQSYTEQTVLPSHNKYMHSYNKPAMPPRSQYVAMDCEMVTTLSSPSTCARVVLVDWKGRTLLDAYVKPSEPVIDYKTFISGITAHNLEKAETLDVVRERVYQLLDGKILVGHGLQNDLECLGINHSWYMIRDTAYYEPFMKLYFGALAPRKLKDLAKEKLRTDIQLPGRSHSPTEDALTALDLYKCHRPRWEACMQSKIKESQKLVRQQVRDQEIQQQMLMMERHHQHQQNYSAYS